MSEGAQHSWEHLKSRIIVLEASHAELTKQVEACAKALDLQHDMLNKLVAMATLQQRFMQTIKEVIYQ